nr:hypothetical protein B0A51_11214 [Rachicladosporium sp. CCFEE 5018]
MSSNDTSSLNTRQLLHLTYACRAMKERPEIDVEVFRQLAGYGKASVTRSCYHKLMRAVLASGTEGGDGAKAGKGKKRKTQSGFLVIFRGGSEVLTACSGMDDDDEGKEGEDGATVAKKQKGVSAEKEGMEEVVQAEEGEAEDAGVEEGDEEVVEINGEAEV